MARRIFGGRSSVGANVNPVQNRKKQQNIKDPAPLIKKVTTKALIAFASLFAYQKLKKVFK